MTAAIRPHVIGPADTAWHPAYCDYVARVFSQADFRRWCEWGQWSDDYRAFCLVEDGRVVANASVSRMRLIVDGAQIEGFQLGAVGCLPERRGRGLARRALQAALEACGAAPVLLFANETVLQFYPRFGFRPAPQHLFLADFAAAPGADPAPRADLADPATRAEFLALAAIAAPVDDRFGARGYGRIATWYAANGYASPCHRIDARTWVFAQCEDDVLTIEDVFAADPVDLAALAPRLIQRPVRALAFGFTPQRGAWPLARAVAEEADAGLFVRGFDPPAAPSRFPLLART